MLAIDTNVILKNLEIVTEKFKRTRGINSNCKTKSCIDPSSNTCHNRRFYLPKCVASLFYGLKMRRSLAPSQRTVLPSANGTIACTNTTKPPHRKPCSNSNDKDDSSEQITIKRLPLFGFLSIPESLNKQFRVPTGCVITEK